MYSFHESLISFSSTITLPDTPFRQFDPVISYLSFTICFAIREISFWCSGSFRSLAHSFCFFSFAEEITLLAFCLHFLYSIHASFSFPLFRFLYVIFFSLTASATCSFHQHVSVCLQGPFDIPHMFCAVSIIIFFILCQCSFTSRCFHSSSSSSAFYTFENLQVRCSAFYRRPRSGSENSMVITKNISAYVLIASQQVNSTFGCSHIHCIQYGILSTFAHCCHSALKRYQKRSTTTRTK